MEYIAIIIILVIMIGIYLTSYKVNNQTKIPEGLEERYNEAQTCSGCHAKGKMLIPEEIIIEFKEDNSL